MLCIKVVLFLLTFHTEYTYGQTIWNMHDACGTVISRADLVGEIHFDADQLPVASCKVTITPLKLDNTFGMVLFYFTTFRFHDPCEKTNITILDGDSNYDSVVNGLPKYICGMNTTLEESSQYFSSTGTSLKIIYNSNKEGINKPGVFVMKFVSYHTGYCSGTDVHECSNDHCVPNEYACSEHFNVCGDIDTNCETGGTSEDSTTETILSSVLTVIFVILFVGFTVYGFCMVHRTGRGGGACRCLGELCECICEVPGRCCRGIGNACENCCRCSRRKCNTCGDFVTDVKSSCGEHCTECCNGIRNKWSGCVFMTETTNQGTTTSTASGATDDPNIVTSQPSSSQRNATPAVTTDDSSSTSSDSELESEDTHASSISITPTAPPIQTSSLEDPPPSYEEAVAPSYKDYIANKERYGKHRHKKSK